MSDRLDYDEPADDIAAPPDGWGEYAALSAEIESLKERLRDTYTAGDDEAAAALRAGIEAAADDRMALERELIRTPRKSRLCIRVEIHPLDEDDETAALAEILDGIEAAVVPDSFEELAGPYVAPLYGIEDDVTRDRAAPVIVALMGEQQFETAPAITCRMVAAARESLRRTTDHRRRAALRRILAALEDLARHAVAYDTARRDPAHPAWTPDPPPEADHRPELVDFEAVAALVESLARQAMPPVSPLLSAAEHRAAAQQTPDPARAAAHLTAAAFAEAAERAALLAAYLASALRRLDELRAPPEPPPRRRPCVIRGTPAPVVRQPAAPHGPPTRAPRDRVAVLATA